jgi:hypothetical protein
MPQAQAERIVAAMLAGSRMANTGPSKTDSHPRSDVLINWPGITGPADWKTAQTSVTAQRTAKLLLHPLPGRSSTQQPESRACTSKPGTSAQTRHHDAYTPGAITWARTPNSPEL